MEIVFDNIQDFYPSYYKRYVDDTICLFNNPNDKTRFLEYINSLHNNIKFTMEVEHQGKRPYLDVDILRGNRGFETKVYRKSTFSGLGLNLLSYSV